MIRPASQDFEIILIAGSGDAAICSRDSVALYVCHCERGWIVRGVGSTLLLFN